MLTLIVKTAFMKHGLIFLTFLTSSCNAPCIAFRGSDVKRITIAQSTFDVRVKDRRAEAIRTNMEWAPRLEAVLPRAVTAIEQASGCKVARVHGDAALIKADLACAGEPVPAPPPMRCKAVEVDAAGTYRGDTLFECYEN